MKRTWSIKFLALFLTIQMAFLSDPSVQLYAEADGMEAPSEQYVLAQADPFSDPSAGIMDPFAEIADDAENLLAEDPSDMESLSMILGRVPRP